MVGGLGGGGKARRGYGPSGHLARPSSVGDFNEMEEDGWSINQMPDHEVPAEFEKMLENMNLSDVSCVEHRSCNRVGDPPPPPKNIRIYFAQLVSPRKQSLYLTVFLHRF